MADRTERLIEAFEHACAVPDPQLFAAAVERDTALEREGDALDGAAVYRFDVAAGMYLYVTRDGRHVIAYQRVADEVCIDRVLLTRRGSR